MNWAFHGFGHNIRRRAAEAIGRQPLEQKSGVAADPDSPPYDASHAEQFAKRREVYENRAGQEAGHVGNVFPGRKALDAQRIKFEVGEIVITPAASAALAANGQAVADLLDRHQTGDWGDVSDQVRTINERGLVERFNLQSTYVVATGQRLVVVTNRERTVTMVHLDPCADGR
jgi:hypothetical protein